jgi:D-alanyl-D-alanine carboxypeptidase/D-alanyl-D-alanine-endopeptidase (penicillin-binding protein 4)
MAAQPVQASPPLPIARLLPSAPDPTAAQLVNRYLAAVGTAGGPPQTQGVWLQSEDQVLASYQGESLRSAASLTKVATSLASLKKYGPRHRFETKIGYRGQLQSGILEGDLWVQGGQDPFFVWEDGFALAVLLKAQGIKQVTGQLVVTGPFFMNFESAPAVAGDFLRQSLDHRLWPPDAQAQFKTLSPGTPLPSLAIAGPVTVQPQLQPGTTWIVQHASLPMAELLKRMNRFSNNPMAEIIANSVGGATAVSESVRALTGLPAGEVQFVNGSGLGEANQISPRGVWAMFQAIAQILAPEQMTLGDIFTVVGQDEGILDGRAIPKATLVKSGTLDQVSTLAGAISTQEKGVIWFVMMNAQGSVEALRLQQEAFLEQIQATWGATSTLPVPLMPTLGADQKQTLNQLINPPGVQ